MPFCRVAVNAPLPLLTYSCAVPLPRGQRVLVPFRGKTVAGVVWDADAAPEIAPEKILPVQHVFAEEPVLPENWLALIAFTSRYYHYPIGQTLFAALPQVLREARPAAIPAPERYFTLGAQGTQGPDRRGSLARPTEPKEVVLTEEGGPGLVRRKTQFDA